MSYITYDQAKSNNDEIISDYFDNDLGQWTNYAALDTTQRSQLINQKHTDLRSFYPATYKPSYLFDLSSTTVGSLTDQVQNINAPTVSKVAEPWTLSAGNGSLAITTTSGWRQLEYTFGSGGAGTLVSTTSDYIDISSFTGNNDKISIALPSLPSMTFASCYVKFSDGTNESPNILFSAYGAGSTGNKELLFPISALGTTLNKKLIKTITFVLAGGTAGDKFICRGIRCLSSTWKYAPIDINTLENKIVKTLPRNGVSGSYEFSSNTIGSNSPTDWPVLYSTFAADGSEDPKDPKVINGSIYSIIECGPTTADNTNASSPNVFTFYLRNHTRTASQIELNRLTQNNLNAQDFNELSSNVVPRTQGEFSKIVGAVTGLWGPNSDKSYQLNPELLPTQAGTLQSGLTVVSDTTKVKPNPITAISANGTTVTYTTALDHGLSNGGSVTITGFNPSGYNVTNNTTTVVVNSRQFTITNNTTASVTAYGSLSGNFYQKGAITNQSGSQQIDLEQKSNGSLAYLAASVKWYKPIYSISAASWSSNKILFTTTTEHYLNAGDTVVIANAGTNYNGEYQVTNVSSKNQFEVTQNTNPGSSSLNSATVTLKNAMRFSIHIDDELSTLFEFNTDHSLSYWQSTNNKKFIFKTSIDNRTIHCKLFELVNDKLNLILSTNQIESNFFHHKRGRIGWYANIKDYQTKIESVRAGRLVYGEFKSKLMNSITPVKGVQIFANQTADKELVDDVTSNIWSIATNSFSVEIDRSIKDKPVSIYQIQNSNNYIYQGIQTNKFKINNFEDIYIKFDLKFNSNVNPLLAFLYNENSRTFHEINMPYITKGAWNSIKLFLHDDSLIPGSYALILAEGGYNNSTSWYVKNVSIKQRNVRWRARSFTDGPWQINDRDWIENYYVNLIPNNDFTKGTNRHDGITFGKQDTELQIRADALNQYVEIFNFEAQPKYATPGNFIWSES